MPTKIWGDDLAGDRFWPERFDDWWMNEWWMVATGCDKKGWISKCVVKVAYRRWQNICPWWQAYFQSKPTAKNKISPCNLRYIPPSQPNHEHFTFFTMKIGFFKTKRVYETQFVSCWHISQKSDLKKGHYSHTFCTKNAFPVTRHCSSFTICKAKQNWYLSRVRLQHGLMLWFHCVHTVVDCSQLTHPPRCQ